MSAKRIVPVPVTPELAALMQKRREMLDPKNTTPPGGPEWLQRLEAVNHLIALHFEVAMTLAYDRRGWTL